VAKAFGATVKSLVGVLVALNGEVAAMEEELVSSFEAHPDAEIIRSLPGLGVILGPRVLGEFGDDRTRYGDAKGLSQNNLVGLARV
jgi:transposase